MAKVSILSPERAAEGARQGGESPDARPRPLTPAVLAALAVYTVMVLRTAWVSDDAFITMRTVDNFVDGYGLRWNVAERVQSYTHPLWMLLLSALYACLGSHYFTLVIAGIATSLAAAYGLAKYLARSPEQALLALLVLTASRSFIDYSTSGLENPLLHLLSVAALHLYLVRPAALRWFALTIALLAFARMDAALIFAPALAHSAWNERRRSGLWATLKELLLGFTPFLAWELFSLFYYGFLFPNTAYAKLNTGIPALPLARQGLAYLLGTLSWDPLGFAAIGLGLAAAALSAQPRQKLLGLGALLHLLYVVKVGGDFMAGRFLTLTLFVLVASFAHGALPDRPSALRIALPLLLLLLLPQAGEEYPVVNNYRISGVVDERACYRDATALVMYTHGEKLPVHAWKHEARVFPVDRASVVGTAGMHGAFAPRAAHIIDHYALTDPLLARLPAKSPKHWRVGHYPRLIPEGYLATLRDGTCQIQPASLCRYYEKLKLVVRGELWSWGRLSAIVALNLWEKPALAPDVSP